MIIHYFTLLNYLLYLMNLIIIIIIIIIKSRYRYELKVRHEIHRDDGRRRRVDHAFT